MKRRDLVRRLSAAGENAESDATKARGLAHRFPNRLWADVGSAKPITNRRSGTLRLAMVWLFALALAGGARGAVSGSDGHDGSFHPATHIVRIPVRISALYLAV